MKIRIFFATLAMLFFAGSAEAAGRVELPWCTVAQAIAGCGGSSSGSLFQVFDGLNDSDCVLGGGEVIVACIRTGGGGVSPFVPLGASGTGAVPFCTTGAAVTAGTCGSLNVGSRVAISDASAVGVCDMAGGGTADVVCERIDASTWRVDPNLEIDNSSVGLFDFGRPTTGSVAIESSDDDGTASLIVRAGGTGTIELGSDTNVQLNLKTDGVQATMTAAGDFTVVATGTNIPTFIGADAATPTSTIFTTTGAGTVMVGTAGSTTAVRLEANVNIESSAPVIDFLDSDTTTDRYIGARVVGGTCTDTGAGTEDCDITLATSEAGTLGIRLLVDADGDNVFEADSQTVNYAANTATPDNRIVGLAKISLGSIGPLTNGVVQVSAIMDDSPEGECAPSSGGTEADDTTTFRVGTTSYQYTFDSSVAAAEGLDCDVTGAVTVNASTSVGFWFRSDTTFASADLEILLLDAASAEATEDMPALRLSHKLIIKRICFYPVKEAMVTLQELTVILEGKWIRAKQSVQVWLESVMKKVVEFMISGLNLQIYRIVAVFITTTRN